MIPERHFSAGEVIIRENDPGEAAYVIRRGKVKVTKQLGGKDVTLALLGPGQIFGEMSMIDDKPRSATVTALEDTAVGEIHQDDFFRSLQSDNEVAVNLLSVLFERLRETNTAILQLQANQVPQDEHGDQAETRQLYVDFEGLTGDAQLAIPDGGLRIENFPFRIGRASPDPLARNDWAISDNPPWQISRHHLTLICQNGKIGAVDRGSRLGSEIDGNRIGGHDGNPGPVFFEGSEGLLILGTKESAYKYKLHIHEKPAG